MVYAKHLEKKAFGGAVGGEGVSVAGSPSPPDPQVVEKPMRRRFTNAYKLDLLRQADACVGIGQIGALLRREGLYSSHLVHLIDAVRASLRVLELDPDRLTFPLLAATYRAALGPENF